MNMSGFERTSCFSCLPTPSLIPSTTFYDDNGCKSRCSVQSSSKEACENRSFRHFEFDP